MLKMDSKKFSRWLLVYHADGETFVNDDISKIDTKDIPDHDLLVGGFPCQDYSVAERLQPVWKVRKAYFGGKYFESLIIKDQDT